MILKEKKTTTTHYSANKITNQYIITTLELTYNYKCSFIQKKKRKVISKSFQHIKRQISARLQRAFQTKIVTVEHYIFFHPKK